MRHVWVLRALLCMLTLVVLVSFAFVSFLPRKGWEQHGSALTALTTALFWEGAGKEPTKGLHAITWAIFNRVASEDFPDSVREVVVQGAQPGRKGGCQFSFVCDGYNELPETLCSLRKQPVSYCRTRWLHYLALAAWWLYVSPGKDPTHGAVLYYAAWMNPPPYWVDDLAPGTIKKIGSHIFGQSKYIGRDLFAAN